MANFAVVGAGRWGKNHVRTLHESGKLRAIVETDPGRRQEMAALYPKVAVYASVQESLAADVDGYVVATPAASHFAVTKFLLEQGKHVLVEKPLALSSKDAAELADHADRKGCKLMVGHVLLYHPAIRKIKELLDQGQLGKLQYMYSNRLNLGTVRTEENILWSFAPHDISIFQYFVGAMPEAVVCEGGVFLQPDVHDTTMTVLRYPENVVGHIFVSWLHPFKEHRLVVIGSKGMVSFEDSSARKELLFYEKGIDWVAGQPVTREGMTRAIDYEKKMPLTEELRHFVECVEQDKVPFTDARVGVEVLRILEMAEASLKKVAPRPPAREFYAHESAVVDKGAKIGRGTKIWHNSQVQAGAQIGENCVIGHNCFVAGRAVLGNGVKLESNVDVWDLVTLEDYVFAGPSAVFTNDINPRSRYPKAKYPQYGKWVPTLVREGASIGANATIVCGVTIGRHAFIGAGAVVTRDVPDYGLVVGSPARLIGWMCACGTRLSLPKEAPDGAEAQCPACARTYRFTSGSVVEVPHE
ncbi:MAG: Gfo/Idh/MocA family oxidoreductase [bacterium]|nr:Gfo/Idh/MocA family oxidoreductase [bacterium]